MKASITLEVRRKYCVDPVLPRKPSAERPPIPSEKQTLATEETSSEIPETEAPFP